MLRKVIYGLGLLSVLIIVGGLLLPRTVSVERSATIDAPPQVVFSYLDTYERFNEWSPWAARDPEARYTYSGPDRGVGAAMAWESDNPHVGNGSQTIIAVEQDKLVRTRLNFGPEGDAESVFKLAPAANGGTEVTWGFETDLGYDIFGRYLGLMFDTWIGADYEEGLQNLKAAIEKDPEDG